MADSKLDKNSSSVEDGLNINKLIDDPVACIKALDANDKLKEHFPAIEQTKGVKQSSIRHPEGDVFTHTLMVLENLDKETPSDKEFGPIIDPKHRLILILAILYHDTGKFERNRDETPEKRIGHPQESEKHVQADLAELVSDEELQIVNELVRKHDLVLEKKHMSQKVNKLYKLFAVNDELELGRLLLKLSECDMLGRGFTPEKGHTVEKAMALLHRNIELYKLLTQLEAEKGNFPLQHIHRTVRDNVSELLGN